MERTTTPSGERLASDGWYGDVNHKLRSILTGGWYDATIVVPGAPDSYIGRRWQEDVVLAQERAHVFTISQDKILLGEAEEELAKLKGKTEGKRQRTVIRRTIGE
jgi:hypothetical protein